MDSFVLERSKYYCEFCAAAIPMMSSPKRASCSVPDRVEFFYVPFLLIASVFGRLVSSKRVSKTSAAKQIVSRLFSVQDLHSLKIDNMWNAESLSSITECIDIPSLSALTYF